VSRGEVPTDVLQRAFADSGLSKSEVARRMGWIVERPDARRVSARLGLIPHSPGRRSTRADYETAVNLIHAMGLDPVDYGL